MPSSGGGVGYLTPITPSTDRLDIIAVIHDRLSALATNAGFTASEASYGGALDTALRALLDGSTDVTLIDEITLNTLYDVLENAALHKLRNYYILQVDVTVGPRKESLNQIVSAIDKRLREMPHTVSAKYEYDALDISDGRSGWPLNWFELGYDLL